MSVAIVTEIIAGSSKSFDDAIEEGIKRATQTLQNVTSVWVKDQSIDIKKDKINSSKVVLKVKFILK